ncbi:5'/3'-nucleotidase SurE [Aquibaculum sediminis]|uniref:5'/3'-nucleotidase SurE n=1 Tax=Aquibaculum sediminis TaxID=3231907 RepID=UPI0034572496
MTTAAQALRGERILVTNDDGIHAPGLRALEAVARSLSDDVWVVAPEVEQSAASHSLTLRRPLRIRRFAERRLAVDGTPTDCVVVAVNHLLKDRRPGLVLSGVNHGGNLAEDVGYSGTVAAAMEATLLGIRSIAFSQLRSSDAPTSFAVAEQHAPDIVRRLYEMPEMRDRLFNVNFPPVSPDAVTGVRVARQGRRDDMVGMVEGRDPGGHPYVWIGHWGGDATEEKDTDLAAIQDGAISVTPLHLDLTHEKSLALLKERFA